MGTNWTQQDGFWWPRYLPATFVTRGSMINVVGIRDTTFKEKLFAIDFEQTSYFLCFLSSSFPFCMIVFKVAGKALPTFTYVYLIPTKSSSSSSSECLANSNHSGDQINCCWVRPCGPWHQIKPHAQACCFKWSFGNCDIENICNEKSACTNSDRATKSGDSHHCWLCLLNKGCKLVHFGCFQISCICRDELVLGLEKMSRKHKFSWYTANRIAVAYYRYWQQQRPSPLKL